MEEPKNIFIIGFQEIEFKEGTGNGRCIWCSNRREFNVAHIFSKKIIRNNHPQNVLRKSVCTDCNSYFGNKIEDWFYKYSPLGTMANTLHTSKERVTTNLKYVPNFLWSDIIKEWMVVNHDKSQDFLATQLLLNGKNELMTFHFAKLGKEQIETLLEIRMSIVNKLASGYITDYISDKLPTNFSPRFYVHKEKVIIIARSYQEKNRLIDRMTDNNSKGSSKYELEHIGFGNIEKLMIHYSWSLQRYFILCAKIGFEFLSFIIGQENCQDPRFELFKKAIKQAKFDKIVVPYVEGKGYQVKRLTPPGWVGYVKTEKIITGFPIMAGSKKNCHTVFIYSVKGYLLFDVKLFALEPCQLIIAKNYNLDAAYYIEYDLADQTLRFFKMGKRDVYLEEKLDFASTLETIKLDQHLAMVTLRDLNPPTLLL